MNRRLFLAAVPALLATGCGFQLRRSDGIPFATLYVDAPPGSLVAQRIRNSLTSNRKTRLAATRPAKPRPCSKFPRKTAPRSSSRCPAQGRVTEYRLGLRLSYSVDDKAGRVWRRPRSSKLTRDITYDDTKVLAKGAEEQLLYRDMDDNAAQRIVRRLQAIKPGSRS